MAAQISGQHPCASTGHEVEQLMPLDKAVLVDNVSTKWCEYFCIFVEGGET
jgi:hypothetical protein